MQQRFVECERLTEAKLEREQGILRDVSICGTRSTNGRIYPESVLRGAIGMYEGRRVRLNHHAGNSDVRSRFGELRGVAFRDGKLRGDLHFLTKHPDADWLAEAVEKKYQEIGLSHDVLAEYDVLSDGTVQITQIREVRSVDIVDGPATNRSFTESGDDTMSTFRQFAESLPANAKVRQMLVGLSESCGDIELAFATGDDQNTRVAFALESAAQHLQKKPANKQDPPTPVKENQLPADLNATVAAAIKEATAPLTAELAKLQQRELARDVLIEARCEVVPSSVEELIKLESADKMREAVEAWPLVKQRPSIRPNLKAAGDQFTTEAELPKDAEEFCALLGV